MNCEKECNNFVTCRFSDEGMKSNHCNFFIAKDKDRFDLLVLEIQAERTRYLSDAKDLGKNGNYISAHDLIIKSSALHRILEVAQCGS